MQSECCCLSCAFSDLTSTDHWKWPEYGVTCDVCHVVSVLRSSDLNSQPILGGSRILCIDIIMKNLLISAWILL